jgi:hypothetical protein
VRVGGAITRGMGEPEPPPSLRDPWDGVLGRAASLDATWEAPMTTAPHQPAHRSPSTSEAGDDHRNDGETSPACRGTGYSDAVGDGNPDPIQAR